MDLTVVNRGSKKENAVLELSNPTEKIYKHVFKHWTWPQIGDTKNNHRINRG